MDVKSCIRWMQYLNSKLQYRDVLNKFSQLNTYGERFTFILETIVQIAPVVFDIECKKKNTEHSKKLRHYGNTSYMKSQYYKALQEYTESIVYAVDSSEELALAYANRSAALLELKKYEDCIKDIDRALDLKYPDRLKTKLYRRKGLSLMSLGRPGADSSFEEAMIWLDKTTLSKDKINESKHYLRNLIATPYSVAELPQNTMKYPLPEIVTPNPKIPCASDAVAIKYSKKFGRHIVATRKIRPGEILVVEKPYCGRLITKHIYTNCSHCFKASWSMIPCNHCVYVAYCSETCKDEAWDKYHEVECSVVGFLESLRFDDSITLCMRMAIIATKKGMKLNELREEIIIIEKNEDLCASLFSDDGQIHSDRYRSIHLTEAPIDEEMSKDPLGSGAAWAALAVCILARESEMFGKKLTFDTLVNNPDVIFVGELMYKHLHLGPLMKTHKFGLANDPNGPVDYGYNLVAIGSLFNHSCDANTARQWYSNHMIAHAVYPIEAGEQLFDDYGANFTLMTRTQRREQFKSCKFDCDCLPCTEDWPMFDGIPSYKEQTLTPEQKRKINKVVQNLEKCNSITRKVSTANDPNVLNHLAELIELLFTLVKRPCGELILANILMKVYYAADETIIDFEPKSPNITKIGHDVQFALFKQML